MQTKLPAADCATWPPGSAFEAFKQFDMGLCHSLESITCSSLDDAAWQQAALPIQLGGLGLREAVASAPAAFAPAAFLGSRNTTRELTSHLVGSDLSTSPNISGDEEEGILRTKLSAELPGINRSHVCVWCPHKQRKNIITRLYRSNNTLQI